ncbi:hypothetical protein BC826DRAFT_972121 [Russula brevipes]|nr:hypothetical protein BC826DRAFT_972121 [Russula brevipes]
MHASAPSWRCKFNAFNCRRCTISPPLVCNLYSVELASRLIIKRDTGETWLDFCLRAPPRVGECWEHPGTDLKCQLQMRVPACAKGKSEIFTFGGVRAESLSRSKDRRVLVWASECTKRSKRYCHVDHHSHLSRHLSFTKGWLLPEKKEGLLFRLFEVAGGVLVTCPPPAAQR